MNKPYSIINFFFCLLLFLYSVSKLDAQSKQLAKHIDEKLIDIDGLIANEDYNLALSKLVDLESYKDFMTSNENRLRINLKRAQANYGNDEEEAAMSLLLNGLDELASLNIPVLKIDYLIYLGEIFRKSRDYTRSIDYLKKSFYESQKIKDTLSILKSNYNIGLTFDDSEKNDSAIFYYNRVIEFKNLKKYRGEVISNAFNNLSIIANNDNDLELAEEYINNSIEIRREENDTLGTAIGLINLSNIFFKRENFNKVKDYYLEAYDAIENFKTRKAFSAKEDLLYNLAYVYEELGDFNKAYRYLEKASNLSDSLGQAIGIKSISEVNAKYNVAKEAQKTEEEKSRRERTQYLFYSSIFAFITFLVLSYIFYRNYRLKREREFDRVVNETQIKIINATIDAKENERKSIAETLHDSVSALLSSANLHLQATKAQLKTGYPQEITKAQTIVNEASVKIRDLSHELISSVLLKFGLAFAVHDMCQKYSNSEISLFSDDDGIERYEQNFEIKIHNIIEELVNNILKHSKAKNASIILAHRDNNMLSIRMNDDGIGFDAKSAKMKGGLGLSHIDARIKVMKGVFNIVSSKDNGTSIFILVPIISREI